MKEVKEIETLVEDVRAGLREGSTEEELFQSLVGLWRTSPETAGRVADLLGGVPDARIGRILQRLLDSTSDKLIRKTIKRSLYRLKSRGVSVEDPLSEKRTSILRPLQAESAKGFGGSIDSAGQRLLLLVLPRPGGGITAMEGVVSDTEGLLNFSGAEMTRKHFRTFFDEFQKEQPFPAVEMEPAYVASLFSGGYQLTLKRKETPPQDYLNLKGQVEKVGKHYERPPIYASLRSNDLPEQAWALKKSGDLLKTDLFEGWVLEESRIRPYADGVSEAGQTKLVLNEAQKAARIQEIYQNALMELFPEERRLLYKRRIEEMAYVLFKQGREEEARTSLSAAMDLEKPLNPFQPNPFLFQLVVRSILSLLQEEKEKKEREPSFIIRP
jgi:hypothetical protein